MIRQSFFITATVVLINFCMVGIDSLPFTSMSIESEAYGGEVTSPEAIKVAELQIGKDEPICNPSKRPEIDAVEPDEVKPGDKMIVTGRHFGEKAECLYQVTIGYEEGENPTYINAEKLEVTVPDSAKPGMTFLNIQSGGGAARSAILVQAP